MATPDAALLQQIDKLSAPEIRRLLAEHLTSRKLGLTWERDAIAHDRARTCSNSQTPSVLPVGGADCQNLRSLPAAVPNLRGADAHHRLHHPQR